MSLGGYSALPCSVYLQTTFFYKSVSAILCSSQDKLAILSSYTVNHLYSQYIVCLYFITELLYFNFLYLQHQKEMFSYQFVAAEIQQMFDG